MRSTQASVLETLQRTQRFLDAHADVLGDFNTSSARKNLDDVVATLSALAATQDGSTRSGRGETGRQQSLRAALRFDHMRPIAEIAREQLRHAPEFDALKMPSSRTPSTLLVGYAGGMAKAAMPHKQVLMDGGLPDDFLDRLRAAADALSQSINGRDVHIATRVGSSAGLEAQKRRGKTVLNVLDSRVRSKLGADDLLLAEWENTIAVRAKPGPAAGTAPGTPVTTLQPAPKTTPQAQPAKMTPQVAQPQPPVEAKTPTLAGGEPQTAKPAAA